MVGVFFARYVGFHYDRMFLCKKYFGRYGLLFIFEFRENSIVVTLPLKYLVSDVVDKVAYKPVDNVILNATQERLLRELRNNPNLTQPKLASIMGLGKSAIQNNISFLKKNTIFVEYPDWTSIVRND